jgi:FAD/FMN-containing dehydrogenase
VSLIVRKLGLSCFKGYSFLSSQYGLTVDNVAGYELVLPNGTIVNVTSRDCDLWFGLRVSKKLDTSRCR